MEYQVPFFKRRIVLLAGMLILLAGVATVSLWRRGGANARLEQAATDFLLAADRGDWELCRSLTSLEEPKFRFFTGNRTTLGELKSRTLLRSEPLRFGDREGYLYTFNSSFEAGTLREIIAVLAERGKTPDVFSARFNYPRLPRPKPHTHYNGPRRAEIRARAEAAWQAFDRNDYHYFNAIARYDVGYARSNGYKPLENFRQRFGPLLNRSPMQEIRYADGLPGCSNLKIARVLNRTSYKVKEQVLVGEEAIYLVRDEMEAKPAWHVYAFDPGRPRRLTVPRKPPAGK